MENSSEDYSSDIEYADADNKGSDMDILPNDWRQLKLLKNKLEHALNRELFTDLTCILGQGEEKETVKCNSFFLRLHSKPFDLDFTNKNFPSEVWFPHLSPNGFRKFLLFMYTEKFHVSVTEALILLEIAKEFQVQPLLERCFKVLKDQIDIPNSCKIYIHAAKCYELELQQFVRSFILENATEVFKTQGFLDLSHECLKSLLESHDKNINEVSAFNAMIRWAKVQCESKGIELTPSNLREVLNGCVDLIKFEGFTPVEFSEFVVDANILNETLALQTLKKLNLNQGRSPFNISKLSFTRTTSSSSGISEFSDQGSPTSHSQILPHNSKELLLESVKQIQLPVLFKLKRYKTLAAGPWIRGGIEKLTFKCHKSLKISGVGIYGRSSADLTPITASLTLWKEEMAQIASVRKSFPVFPDSGTLPCLFDSPITLEAKQWYTLALDVTGEVRSFAGPKKKVNLCMGKEAIAVEFKIRKVSTHDTPSSSRGTIPELYFCI